MVTIMKELKPPTHAQLAVLRSIEAVSPLLKKLKITSANSPHITQRISTLEANLQQLIESYTSITSISEAYRHLTLLETQVAALVRVGQSTAAIADTLNLSTATVQYYRKRIRKKLGLHAKEINLHRYLLSLKDSAPQ